jgi:hypothetical protein
MLCAGRGCSIQRQRRGYCGDRSSVSVLHVLAGRGSDDNDYKKSKYKGFTRGSQVARLALRGLERKADDKSDPRQAQFFLFSFCEHLLTRFFRGVPAVEHRLGVMEQCSQ